MNLDVVVCTYNRAEKLNKALRSLLEAELLETTAVRFIVVDNNSTDGTKSVVEDISGTVPPRMSITYLFEQKQGKSHALNTALEQIAGDMVAFTDDDVTVDKGWIKEMVGALQRYPGYNCFGGRVVAQYPDNLPRWLDLNGSMKFVRSVFVDTDGGAEEIDFTENTVSQTPGGVNMFFRRKTVEKNGLFRTDLGPQGRKLGFSEDTEYCRRLLGKGERFMYIPSAIVYHPVHEDRLSKEYLLNWQYNCGRSEVRRCGGYSDTRKIFGVPRYLYRKLIEHSIGWSISLDARKKFYHRLRLYYAVGEVLEHLKIGSITQ